MYNIMYNISVIIQFGTRFRRLTPEPCAKFHDDSMNAFEVINKRDFEISGRRFLSNPGPRRNACQKSTERVEKATN